MSTDRDKLQRAVDRLVHNYYHSAILSKLAVTSYRFVKMYESRGLYDEVAANSARKYKKITDILLSATNRIAKIERTSVYK